MISKILPDFQEFLTSRALIDKKHAPFYARWVSKILTLLWAPLENIVR